jgi:hypothetical protein
MHRVLLGVVIAVVALAVGAVVMLAVRNNGDLEQQTPTPSARQSSSIAETAGVDDSDSPDLPTPVIKQPAGTQPKVSAAAPNPRPSAPAEESDEVRERMAKLLDSLTDEERQALVRENRRRDMEARRERRRYALPSDRKLRGLDRLDDALKLSDVQRAQVEATQATFKPQIEMALQDVWARQSELGQTMRELWAAGEREEAGALREQFGELREESNKIKAELDARYTESLAGILSTEQIEAMATMPESSGRDRRGRRGGGGRP